MLSVDDRLLEDSIMPAESSMRRGRACSSVMVIIIFVIIVIIIVIVVITINIIYIMVSFVVLSSSL